MATSHETLRIINVSVPYYRLATSRAHSNVPFPGTKMTISIYEGRRYQRNAFVNAMTIANLCLVTILLGTWSIVDQWIRDPMLLLAGGAVHSNLSLWAYPFGLLWGLPLFGVLAGYVATVLGYLPIARFAVSFPILLLFASCIWLLLFSPA
jgi:hypothetical protein